MNYAWNRHTPGYVGQRSALAPRRPTPLRLSFITALALAAVAALALAPAAGAQPTFAKSFSPSTIGPGSVSTLTFTITSSVGARSLAFTDTLPSGVTIATPANATTDCFGTLSAPDGGSTITFSDGAIGASSSCSITVDVTSSTPGTHTNVSGDLTSDAGNSGSATADLTVATDRPGFTKSFSPASISFGGRSTLTFTIDNSANSASALNLLFTDSLPAGMTVASPANASTTCGGTLSAPSGGSVVSLGFSSPVSQVGAGSTCTVTVDVTATSAGALGNTSGELTSQPGPFGGATRSSGKASAVLTVTIDQLALTKSFTDDPVSPGDSVTLEFSITNLNRSFAATGITFTDNLSATLTGLVATALPANPCGAGSTLTGTSSLTLAGGNLAAGGTCTFSVTLQVPSSATPGAYPNTTSSISADVGGRPVSGGAATDTLFVTAAPVLTKTFVPDTAGGGDTVTLEFTLTSTSAATGIGFTDNLAAFLSGLVVVTSLPISNPCGSGSFLTLVTISAEPTLVFSGGSLGASDSCSFSVDLKLAVGTAGGTYTNTTSDVTATVDGETATSSPASDDLTVVSGPTLLKQFTDDPVAPGDTVTLEFTLSQGEEAGGTATAIAFTDDLSATLSGLTVAALPSGTVCGGGTLTGTTSLSFSGGSLAPGDSCSFSATLQVPAAALPGAHTNTTSNVMATVGGVTLTSDSAADDLVVTGLTFTKEFTDDPVIAGETVTLQFTLENTSSNLDATNMTFTDSLSSVLSGLASTSGTLTDVCGSGSQITGTGFLVFTGGNLAAGQSCTFSVTLQVPASAASGTYPNVTSNLVVDVDSTSVVLDPASDGLEVANDVLVLAKEFTDDPVAPGDLVTLEFTVTNLAPRAVSGIEFTDDLDAALSGLVSVSGSVPDVCGTGSSISGTGFLSFTGGSLAAEASCTFSVTLQVPTGIGLGTVATNTTSEVTGSVLGLPVSGGAASDVLRIDFLSFSKAFDGPVEAGDTVTLTFTIENPSESDTFGQIAFTDDLSSVLSGLTAVVPSQEDVCGEGSELSGTTFLTLTGGSLLPGGSCTFSVDLQVPASTEAGDYDNVTSELSQRGDRAAAPATATLTVFVVTDHDGDGVLDGDDVCPGTEIPEGVPTQELGRNRFALVDGDGIFDTNPPPGHGPGLSFTIEDTAGCSCEQIIAAQGLGQGHVKFGCSISAMQDWIALVNP